MPTSLTRWSSLLLALMLAVPIIAQEGFPLKGSWIGVWEGNTQSGDDVLVIMDWDGEHVTGIINPGTDDIKIANATLDPDGWKVHIEANGKNKQGGDLHYVIDGVIEQIELPSRAVVGTWKSESGNGKFDIRRQ